ncbi:Molecular chaperone Prefoldin, subunit 4 [Ceraceosorus bombacis]|uniref:Prefoldin subunit 4 n=1 Tax=Ceraceosorus bombacis TaxID=401625 RepID=A0A0P1B931_9BASI|nr:Molecular chaperone Prefoldin, subunit 4 [Ceraceosorus bombacis]
MRMLDDKTSNDVEVSKGDQDSINKFSRLNNKSADLEQRLEKLRDEKEALSDAVAELELLELDEDEDDLEEGDDGLEEDAKDEKATGGASEVGKVMFKVGDAYMHLKPSEAVEMANVESERLTAEVEKLAKEKASCEEGMRELKVKLYAKFGDNINLER